MNRTHFITLLLAYTLLPAITSAQSIYMKHYTINDGLAGNHVYMCHQDLNGYLWIATTSGLSRFDGKKFKNYDYEDGLLDNEILFVTNDADNNIWVNTFSPVSSISVIRNDNVKDHNSKSILSIPTQNVNLSDEYYSPRGKITYISGSHTLVIIKNNKPVFKSAPFNPGSPLFETEDGRFFGGDGKSLYSIRDIQISFFQSLSVKTPYSRLCYYGGILYVVTGNIIRLYRYTSDRFEYIKTETFQKKINLVHVNQHGVWVAFTDEKGVSLYDDYYMNTGYIDVRIPGFVNHFTNDKEGGMWVSTTDNGLFFLPDPGMISYTATDGLASSVIYTVAPLSGSKFWLGYNTGNAELITLQNRHITINQKIRLGDDHYSNNQVLDIVIGKNQTYFLSRNNLNLLEHGALISLTTIGANKSLLLINDTVLGVGAWNYSLLNLKSGKQVVYKIGRVYAQAVDTKANIWLGGINGLYRLPVNNILYKLKKLDGIKINSLAASGQYIWVGTQNNGLYLVKDDSVLYQFTYKNTPGLPSNTIKALAINNNQVWIGTNRGMLFGEFNYANVAFTNTVIIDHNDGLLSPEVNEIKICDSNIFIATYGGITVLDKPKHKTLNYNIPDVFIKSLKDGKSMRGDSLELYYSPKGLEIGFHTVAFKYSGDITYKYKLEPFDNEWQSTKNNLVQYTNIPPGEYHFLVRAYDNRGNSSTTVGDTLIYIMPLFRQTVWFKFLLFFIVLVLVSVVLYLYYRYTKIRTNNKLVQGRLIAKARLDALKAQIKPHFIFNSLNAIKDYIYNNKNDDAADLLQGFSTLIRKGLNLADNDFITIGEETAFLKQYLELERTKCDHCFEYSFDVSENIVNIVIPSLITQPFVENAVIHGMRTVRNGKAVLHISYNLIDNDIICRITDNGIGIKQSLQHKKVDFSRGTAISKDRIGYFKTGLGIDILLDVQDRLETGEAETGTCVTITIKNATQYTK